MNIIEQQPQSLLPVLAGMDVQLISAQAVTQRDELIAQCAGLERVAGESSQEHAADLVRSLQKLATQAESDRKRLKEPFAKIGKFIDENVKQFVAPIADQKARLNGMLSAFQEQLLRAKQEEERKQAAELARIRAEQQAAAQKGDDDARLAAEMKAAEVIASAPIVAAPKTDGMAVCVSWKVAVNDPAALFKVFPELCTITPKMRDINAVVSKMAETEPDKAPVLPGCTITKETGVKIR